jgi:hypothetical protein
MDIITDMNKPVETTDEALQAQAYALTADVMQALTAAWTPSMEALHGPLSLNVAQLTGLWHHGHMIVPIAKRPIEGTDLQETVAVALVVMTCSLMTNRVQYEVVFKATTEAFTNKDLITYIVDGAKFNAVHEVWDMEHVGGLVVRRKVYDDRGNHGVTKKSLEHLEALQKLVGG